MINTSGSQNKFDSWCYVTCYISPLLFGNTKQRHDACTGCSSSVLSNFILQKRIIASFSLWLWHSRRREKWLKTEDLSHCSSDTKYLGRTPLCLAVKVVSFQPGCSLNLIHLEPFAQWRRLCPLSPPPPTALPPLEYVDLSKDYLIW